MDYYLNQYIPVVRNGNKYLFGINGFLSLEEDQFVELNSKQEDVLQFLAKGECLSEDKAIRIFGNDMFLNFIESKILIPHTLDISSIYSRSKAYYFFNKMGNVQEVLTQKKVLILGCGGIGSHVAWNLTTMGVGHITLVDYDSVEESNLNRQLLYDVQDIGRSKIIVLKEKLQRINPNIEIQAIEKKIWSENDLNDIAITQNYDLVIKALDSPAEFPVWLDKVCFKHKLKYIAGITVSSSPMIGPTYIPNVSAGYTDFFNDDREYNYVSGISQQLGVVMYHIASEVSMEAFKLLSGKGELKYLNSICAINEMKNTTLKLTPKALPSHFKEDDKASTNYICIIVILFISMLTLTTGSLSFIPFNVLFSILAPFAIYKTSSKRIRSVFINTFFLMIGNMLILLSGRSPIDIESYDIITLLVSLIVGVNFYIVIAVSFASILNFILGNAKKLNLGRNKI